MTLTSIRLDTDLADEAAKILEVKSRTEAVHVALREIGAEAIQGLHEKASGCVSIWVMKWLPVKRLR